jgi:hypothetical protein
MAGILVTIALPHAAEVAAVREAGYSEQQPVEAFLAVGAITITNLLNRVNDTTLDFPAVD